MFTDLRQFDLAKEFLVQSDQQNARHLITKQADWARTTNDPQAAWYDLLHAYAVSDTLSCAPVGLLSLKCFSFHSHHPTTMPGVLFFHRNNFSQNPIQCMRPNLNLRFRIKRYCTGLHFGGGGGAWDFNPSKLNFAHYTYAPPKCLCP